MIYRTLLLLAFTGNFFYSCGQLTTTVTIHNKSKDTIDSVYFPHNKKSHFLDIKNGEQKKFTIDISTLKAGQDGILEMYLYKNKKVFFASFNYDESGVDDEPTGSHVYLFDNGYQNIDKEPVTPAEFYLYLINKSDVLIDSIKFAGSIQHFIYTAGTKKEITIKLPYITFSKNSRLNIFQNGMNYTILIDHDWDNWNNNQEIYYLNKNGMAEKSKDNFLPHR